MMISRPSLSISSLFSTNEKKIPLSFSLSLSPLASARVESSSSVPTTLLARRFFQTHTKKSDDDDVCFKKEE